MMCFPESCRPRNAVGIVHNSFFDNYSLVLIVQDVFCRRVGLNSLNDVLDRIVI